MKLIKRIETMKQKSLYVLIGLLWLLSGIPVILFFCNTNSFIYYSHDLFGSYSTLIFSILMLLLSFTFYFPFTCLKIKYYFAKSEDFKDVDLYIIEKEYEFTLDLIKEQTKTFPKIVYLFLLSLITTFVFLLNLQLKDHSFITQFEITNLYKDSKITEKDKKHIKDLMKIDFIDEIDKFKNNSIFQTIFTILIISFIFVTYIFYFNERIYQNYLKKLMVSKKLNKIDNQLFNKALICQHFWGHKKIVLTNHS